MKKILFITTSYILKNSSAAIRNNSLVKGLVELGYTVDVCTIQWSKELYSPFFEKEQNGNIYYDQLPNLIRIAKIKNNQIRKKDNKWLTKTRQLLKKILFFPDGCYEWIKKFREIDVSQYMCVISSSDHKTSHFVGLKIKRLYPSLPWIQIWGDPWSTDVNTLCFMKPLIAYYEKKLISESDKVVYVSEVTMRDMQKKYPCYSEKMYTIPRGFYFEINSPIFNPTCMRIVYTGVISYGRNPLVLLKAINKLKLPLSDCTVEFYGNIPLEMREQLNSFPFVKLYDSVDFEHMSTILASASILLYLSNKQGSSQIPGKLFDYMGTNKPILCLVSDEFEPTSMFLKQYERCIVLKNSESDICNNWSKIESACRNIYTPEEKFSPKNIASQVVDLLN